MNPGKQEIPVREGVVFKCVTNGDIRFKAISNKFLLNGLVVTGTTRLID